MTNAPASVRIAVQADQEPLFAFIWAAHEETRYAAKDEGKIRGMIERATTLRRNPVFGLIHGKAGIEAAIGLYYNEWWWSINPVLMSFFWFVHPDYRRGGHAGDLRAFAVWFAAQIGMPLVLVDWSAEETGKTRLFARNGERVGSMFAQQELAA